MILLNFLFKNSIFLQLFTAKHHKTLQEVSKKSCQVFLPRKVSRKSSRRSAKELKSQGPIVCHSNMKKFLEKGAKRNPSEVDEPSLLIKNFHSNPGCIFVQTTTVDTGKKQFFCDERRMRISDRFFVLFALSVEREDLWWKKFKFKIWEIF